MKLCNAKQKQRLLTFKVKFVLVVVVWHNFYCKGKRSTFLVCTGVFLSFTTAQTVYKLTFSTNTTGKCSNLLVPKQRQVPCTVPSLWPTASNLQHPLANAFSHLSSVPSGCQTDQFIGLCVWGLSLSGVSTKNISIVWWQIFFLIQQMVAFYMESKELVKKSDWTSLSSKRCFISHPRGFFSS